MELLIEMIAPYHINQFSSTFIIQTLKNVILKIMIINGAKLFDKNLNFFALNVIRTSKLTKYE